MVLKTDWDLPSIDNITLNIWWEKLFPFVGVDITKRRFIEIYSQAEVVFELPFGIIRLDPLRFGKYAQAHGFFWSSEVFRRLEIFSEIADFIFRMYGVQYILVEVPNGVSGIPRLLRKIGFSEERSGGKQIFKLWREQ